MAKRTRITSASIAVLERALARRRRDVARLEKKQASLRSQLAAVEADLAAVKGEVVKAPAAKRGRPVGRPRRGRRGKESLKEAMSNALRAAEKPMRAADVLQAIVAAGYKSKAKDLKQIVHSTLTRHPHAKRVGRGEYVYDGPAEGAAELTPAPAPGKRGRPRKAAKK